MTDVYFQDETEGKIAGTIEFLSIHDEEIHGGTVWYSKLSLGPIANRYLGRGGQMILTSWELHESEYFDSKEEVIQDFEKQWGKHFKLA